MNGSLKFPITASIVILAVGGAMGLRHQQRLTNLRNERHELVAKAQTLGIATTGTAEATVTKRQRDDRANEARSMSAELIAFGREMELHDLNANEPDEAFEKRGLDLQAKLMNLDASQLKQLVASLRDDRSLSDKTRQNLVCYTILTLGSDHPAAALALFADSADLLGGGQMGASVVSSTLANWSKSDPRAASEWVRKNSAEHPDLAGDDAKHNIVAAAAVNDPELAFKLIGEMNVEDTSAAVGMVIETGKTPGQRTAILAALREHLATLPEGPERGELLQESLETLGRNITNESFQAVQSWITKSELSPEECAQFAGGLSYFNTKQETGRWIDWMADKLPGDKVAQNVDNLIGQWTQQDYLAAGRWLTAAPEGPARLAAVSTYAGTVAGYEPQVAVQWADTLPEGEQRQDTYQTILDNWPKSDSAAAKAFAAKHGLTLERNSIDSGSEDSQDHIRIIPEELDSSEAKGEP
jgi:hypothetical protein